MRRYTLFAAAACVALLGMAALARADEKPQRATSDLDFINEAATGGMAEVKFGQLAMERAASPEVRKFGEKMVHDHTLANKQLASLIKQKGLAMPAKELSPKERDVYDRLSKLRGAAFDRAYIKDMVQDHKQDVALFESVANRGKDADVRAFAMKTLPTLREHLEQAEKLAGRSGR
jgi:putative membrane protein